LGIRKRTSVLQWFLSPSLLLLTFLNLYSHYPPIFSLFSGENDDNVEEEKTVSARGHVSDQPVAKRTQWKKMDG
jgi:hypothetical protein